MNGIERIATAFTAAAKDQTTLFAPYLMGGYPDQRTAEAIAQAYVDGGAGLVELGLPFSDPLADGPVIQAAAAAALRAGASTATVLAGAEALARQLPVVVMGYANLILRHGVERFLDQLLAVGICGLIVPDMPLEETAALFEHCESRGLALVPLVAPTTPEERLALIGERARGFIYTVSVTGITGERQSLPATLSQLVQRVKRHTQLPVAVGFGISTPEQAAAAAAAGADAVIVGTRLVRIVGESDRPAAAAAAQTFVSAVTAALR